MDRNVIGTSIVTYNRKRELLTCLNAISHQTKLPDYVFIIDNCSTDGTLEHLQKNGFFSNTPLFEKSDSDQLFKENVTCESKKIVFFFLRKSTNEGGAGGFYSGMQLGLQNKCDWLWMMDDDGIPDSNQLEYLIKTAEKRNILYLNALVLSKEDKEKLAFPLGPYNYFHEVKDEEIVPGFVNSFNGTLISLKILLEIGLIKKEMFIWGDEVEYVNRVRKSGYEIATVTKAIHKHPQMKGNKVYVFPSSLSSIQITLKPKHLSHIYYKNLGYNNFYYSPFKVFLSTGLLYIIYFVLSLDHLELIKFIVNYTNGARNNYSKK